MLRSVTMVLPQAAQHQLCDFNVQLTYFWRAPVVKVRLCEACVHCRQTNNWVDRAVQHRWRLYAVNGDSDKQKLS